MQPSLNHINLFIEPLFRHGKGNAVGDGAALDVGVGLRRLFVVYNRGYKPMCFVSNDIDEALRIAFSVGHVRKPGAFRRWDELTPRVSLEDYANQFGEPDLVQRALRSGKSGVWSCQDGRWLLGGEPVD